MKNQKEQSSYIYFSHHLFQSVVSVLCLSTLITSGACGDSGAKQRTPVTWIVNKNGGGDFTSIQACINDAIDLDTCLVYPGTYQENIYFPDKAIALRSAQGPNETKLMGANHVGKPVITFTSGGRNQPIVDGFTITGGDLTIEEYTSYGGGIYIHNSSPRVENCIISGNHATQDGGGIFCFSSGAFPEIFHTIFSDNHADQGRGGGLCALHGSPLLFDCLFYNNVAQQGGAIYASYAARPLVSNCTISQNTAAAEGGALFAYEASFTIENSIIWGNTAPDGPEAFITVNSDPDLRAHNASITFSHIDLDGGESAMVTGVECPSDPQPGDISCVKTNLDPNFVTLDAFPDFRTGPYHEVYPKMNTFYLSHEGVDDQTTTSPCVDQGSFSAIAIGLSTRTTRTDQAVDSGNKVDLGFHYPVVTTTP